MTHYYNCIICDTESNCCASAHILGMGDCCGEGEKIEFCSLHCFLELLERLKDRIEMVRQSEEPEHTGWYQILMEKMKCDS